VLGILLLNGYYNYWEFVFVIMLISIMMLFLLSLLLVVGCYVNVFFFMMGCYVGFNVSDFFLMMINNVVWLCDWV